MSCCWPHRKEMKERSPTSLNILLTNGRFPVSIDLARQLTYAGHNVYVVDPMHYHVCKFSNAVRKSWWVATPHVNGTKYVEGVLKAMEEVEEKGDVGIQAEGKFKIGKPKNMPGRRGIDLVIPMHEEIFYLAEACWFGDVEQQVGGGDISNETGHDPSTGKSSAPPIQLNPTMLAKLRSKLLAPPFPSLIMLHNKHAFCQLLEMLDLDCPTNKLIETKQDIQNILDGKDKNFIDPKTGKVKAIALKPVFGRASSNVYHLDVNSSDPKKNSVPDDIALDADNRYIAQEWITGSRFCTYAIIRKGEIKAFGVYPVQDTIDGSSCVYFEAIEHPRIRAYVEKLAKGLAEVQDPEPALGFQVAMDFIEQPEEGGRLVSIECNPRATSGIHLFSGTTALARVFADLNSEFPRVEASQGFRRQLAPGMLMWKNSSGGSKFTDYKNHMKRLVTSKDVMFSRHDVWPSVMQPFLLTSYYEICRERKLKLPVMFQWDLTWEPKGRGVERARVAVQGELDRKKNGEKNCPGSHGANHRIQGRDSGVGEFTDLEHPGPRHEHDRSVPNHDENRHVRNPIVLNAPGTETTTAI